MTSDQTVSVNGDDLRSAFDFVSFGDPHEHSAYIDIDAGKIYWQTDSGALDEEELPDDFEESDRYIAVPHKNDLDLGSRLVWRFVDRELPDDSDIVADYFGRRGAYRRFKDLLERRGMLERWYEFEDRATEAALREWCEDNGIRLVEGAAGGEG